MANKRTSSLAGSVEYGPLIKGPPLLWAMVVLLEAHFLARALIVRAGIPVIGEAHSGVLGVPSSLPRT